MASKLRGSRRANNRAEPKMPEYPEIRETRTKAKPFKPASESQERYINKIYNNTITFGVGPAGTGKSYCAAYVAAEMLKNKEIDKIIITRPIVEAGEQLGFLPGEMEEKVGPYVAPIMECLSKMLGKGHVEALVENGIIEMVPLAYMRGRTFNNSFVILDEAQNVTKKQMLLFLTRIGKDATVVVDGDIDQRDLPVDGLEDAIRRLDRVPSIGIHRFQLQDVVRSGIVKDVIRAYSNNEDFDTFEEGETETSGLEKYLSNKV